MTIRLAMEAHGAAASGCVLVLTPHNMCCADTPLAHSPRHHRLAEASPIAPLCEEASAGTDPAGKMAGTSVPRRKPDSDSRCLPVCARARELEHVNNHLSEWCGLCAGAESTASSSFRTRWT